MTEMESQASASSSVGEEYLPRVPSIAAFQCKDPHATWDDWLAHLDALIEPFPDVLTKRQDGVLYSLKCLKREQKILDVHAFGTTTNAELIKVKLREQEATAKFIDRLRPKRKRGDDVVSNIIGLNGHGGTAAAVTEEDGKNITAAAAAGKDGDAIIAAAVGEKDGKDPTAAAVPTQGQLPMEYLSLIDRAIASMDPAESQLGRHLKELSRWSVVDSEMMAGVSIVCGGREYVRLQALLVAPRISREAMKVLSRLPELRSEVTALAGFYPNLDRSYGFWPFSCKEEPISTLTLISVLLAMKSDAAAGGGTSLEAETKLLSVRIFADLIAVVGGGLRARLEYSHVFDAGTDGLTRSDLAITAPGGGGIEIPIFVLECQKDVRAVHKDHIVCTAQAVLEARRVVPYIGLADLHRARFHMALVSGCIIQFSVLVPECRDGHMFWVINRRGPTFDLSARHNMHVRLIEAMKMTKFILDIIVPDAQFLCRKLQERIVDLDVKALLPLRPSETPKPRTSTASYTPQPKKLRN
ncbi:hypothetical protein HDU85_001072 [Gaertneriomyces sp. JEL0708]|nr:hypothetical protein HDU85_001072 [Gaertneriomyces sp. JEL0708]